MNHLLIDAALTEAHVGGFDAVLQPDPDACCVRLANTADG